jgi:hypothetical protein
VREVWQIKEKITGFGNGLWHRLAKTSRREKVRNEIIRENGI